jgi:hypothetical protein
MNVTDIAKLISGAAVSTRGSDEGRKLRLNKELIRTLSSTELSAVGGGVQTGGGAGFGLTTSHKQP